jgi:hypothetical protein
MSVLLHIQEAPGLNLGPESSTTPSLVAFRMPQIFPYFSVHYSLFIEQFDAV